MIPPRVPNTEAYWRPACSEIFTSTNIKLIFRAFSGFKANANSDYRNHSRCHKI